MTDETPIAEVVPKLAPCPFCGGDFLISQEPWDNAPVAGMWYLYHRIETVFSPSRMCRLDFRGHFESKAAAIAAWNRRAPVAPPDLVRALVEALEEARNELCVYEDAATGEHYNNTKINEALARAKAAGV